MNVSDAETEVATDLDGDGESLSPAEATLLCLYSVVLLVGVLANAGLALTVCGQRGRRGSRGARTGAGLGAGARVRSRSPLLLGLCAADLLVCCLSAPLTVYFALLATRPWPFAAPWCKLAFFLQALPVAASTLSLMLVSVDRYMTVKYPRPVGRLRYRRRSVVAAALCAWLLGVLATCPVLVVRRVPVVAGRCVEAWASAEWRGCYVLCQLMLVHVIPCATVLACHLAVRAKLTALSLTARAAHGELPLPVPLLRRPAHVIIVAGIANNADAKLMTYQHEAEASSDFADNGTVPKRFPSRKRKRQARRIRRATKSEQEIREENRRLRPHHQHESPVCSSTSGRGNTLKARRQLANTLVSAAAVFVGCWLPHVVCTVCMELCTELCALPSAQLKQFTHFSLLLGHAHSAINPVVYWALNHHSLHTSCFSRLRLPTAYRNASSTNEAALGPFHPRFTRPNTPHGPHAPVRRQSSCYLY